MNCETFLDSTKYLGEKKEFFHPKMCNIITFLIKIRRKSNTNWH